MSMIVQLIVFVWMFIQCGIIVVAIELFRTAMKLLFLIWLTIRTVTVWIGNTEIFLRWIATVIFTGRRWFRFDVGWWVVNVICECRCLVEFELTFGETPQPTRLFFWIFVGSLRVLFRTFSIDLTIFTWKTDRLKMNTPFEVFMLTDYIPLTTTLFISNGSCSSAMASPFS